MASFGAVVNTWRTGQRKGPLTKAKAASLLTHSVAKLRDRLAAHSESDVVKAIRAGQKVPRLLLLLLLLLPLLSGPLRSSSSQMLTPTHWFTLLFLVRSLPLRLPLRLLPSLI